MHTGGAQVNNARCTVCHSSEAILTDHATSNSTPNNPQLPAGQHMIEYELLGAAVNAGTNDVTIWFKVRPGPAGAVDPGEPAEGPGKSTQVQVHVVVGNGIAGPRLLAAVQGSVETAKTD